MTIDASATKRRHSENSSSNGVPCITVYQIYRTRRYSNLQVLCTFPFAGRKRGRRLLMETMISTRSSYLFLSLIGRNPFSIHDSFPSSLDFSRREALYRSEPSSKRGVSLEGGSIYNRGRIERRSRSIAPIDARYLSPRGATFPGIMVED